MASSPSDPLKIRVHKTADPGLRSSQPMKVMHTGGGLPKSLTKMPTGQDPRFASDGDQLNVPIHCLFHGHSPSNTKDTAKIKVIDIHPSLSLVASVDETNHVIVWNYRSKTIVAQYFPQEEETHNQDMTSTRRTVENLTGMKPIAISDPRLFHSPGIGQTNLNFDSTKATSETEKKRSGVIRHVRFFDVDVLDWSTTAQTDQSTIANRRLLLVTCDSALLYLDLNTRYVGDICYSTDLEGKSPTCTEPVSNQLIAIGCSDGEIRVWDLVSQKLAKKLKGGHDRPITKLLSISSTLRQSLSPDTNRLRLLSVAADGSTVTWNINFVGNIVSGDSPSASLPMSTENTSGPYVQEGVRVSYNPLNGYLLTANRDRTIGLWEVERTTQAQTSGKIHRRASTRKSMVMKSGTLSSSLNDRIQPVAQFRADQNSRIDFKDASSILVSHPIFPNPAALSANKGPKVSLIVFPISQQSDPSSLLPIYPLFDLRDVVPTLPKKVKIYVMDQHPTIPNILVLGTNMGMFVLELDPWRQPCVAFDSSWIIPMSPDPVIPIAKIAPSASTARLVNSFYCLRNPALDPLSMPYPRQDQQCWRIKPRSERPVIEVSAPDSSPMLLPSQSSSGESRLTENGPIKLQTSPSGRYISVLWERAQQYEIFAVSKTGETTESSHTRSSFSMEASFISITRGRCISLAWAHTSAVACEMTSKGERKVELSDGDRFAVLEPGQLVPLPVQEKKKLKRRTPSQLFHQTPPTLVLKEIEGNAVINVHPEVPTPQHVSYLWGGALLTVVYDSTLDGSEKLPTPSSPVSSSRSTDSVPSTSVGVTGNTESEQKTEDTKDNDAGISWGGTAVGIQSQMLDWAVAEHPVKHMSPVTGYLPEPQDVVWDSSGKFVAFCANDMIQVFRIDESVRPTQQKKSKLHTHKKRESMSNPQLRSNKQLTPICSLPGPVVSTLWYNGSLFMASTDRIILAFPTPFSTTAPTVLLASRVKEDDPSPNILRLCSEQLSQSSTCLNGIPVTMVAEIWDPFVAPCPIGPIKLLGVVQGRLLLAGGMESIYTLELSHPAIRARMLIQGGYPEAAIEWLSFLHPNLHDEFSWFLVERGHVGHVFRALQSKKLHLSKGALLEVCLQSGELSPLLSLISTRGINVFDSESRSENILTTHKKQRYKFMQYPLLPNPIQCIGLVAARKRDISTLRSLVSLCCNALPDSANDTNFIAWLLQDITSVGEISEADMIFKEAVRARLRALHHMGAVAEMGLLVNFATSPSCPFVITNSDLEDIIGLESVESLWQQLLDADSTLARQQLCGYLFSNSLRIEP